MKTIRLIIGITKAKAGSITSSLYSQSENDDELLLIEKQENQVGFESHTRSDNYYNVLAVMEIAIENCIVKLLGRAVT